MSEITKQNGDLISYIKSIILKYCPYIDNRLYILGNAKSPEIDIDINFYDDETMIMFLVGNANFKQSITEQLIISCIVEFEEVDKIIDFILEDHEFIKDINSYNDSIGLKFAINWTDEAVKGINCGDIGLNLKFNNNIELKKQYLYMLFQKYYSVLEHAPTFKKIKNEYINIFKKVYLNNLDKMQLISLLKDMDEKELRELLYNLDNDMFIQYISDNPKEPKSKILFLQKRQS